MNWKQEIYDLKYEIYSLNIWKQEMYIQKHEVERTAWYSKRKPRLGNWTFIANKQEQQTIHQFSIPN